MTPERDAPAHSSLRLARKAVVAVIGFSILAFGVVLGPSALVIPLGLAILATEFLWAGKLLGPIRKLLVGLKAHARRMIGAPSLPAGPTGARSR